SPQIPLLFMGEEWAASSPFMFFVDFSDDERLAAAVREGRSREFARFRDFADESAADKIPDPTMPVSARISVLRWEERLASPHAEVIADTKRLLQLRRAEILPLTRTAYAGANWHERAENAINIAWHYEGGHLRLLANFEEPRFTAEIQPGERAIWKSETAKLDGELAHLPSWSGVMLKQTP
ncbi:MAG: DUF3459 domain-containing protein, partial [Hyphomicrobiales bacterium]|nr:DUF3459 domain-containing protein [Hyphomicrobiales bacterium]